MERKTDQANDNTTHGRDWKEKEKINKNTHKAGRLVEIILGFLG